MITSKQVVSSLVIALMMFAGSAMAQDGIGAAKKQVAPVKPDIQKNVVVLPDLKISRVDFTPNNVFRATVQVANIGLAPSTPCLLMVEVGCSSPKKLIFNIPALKQTIPGAFPDPASQETIVINSPIAFNVSNIKLTVDSQNAVKEKNETNNTWSKNNCVK
ncbi:MAG: CARDB domain-containing protein [Desulfopila sp.]|jgi:hypothetical protein|nr:CARDB domain-containing protein [Desulfopila sp.]